ncbi:ABC transporter substrate-binding protein [Levilactobacillus acidifarinae]|uniref:Glycerol-3-phosphate binding protein n=1 Tax=Levilactobacillus acidifarinae DSM 19394 = JCM 15949 TaxID=1423715 RepID=A0A0R1LPJ8_9LACO|nr:ABC transporter substrate-binding protein [Levilactobacillus acidifarinae]KRK94649.1 glycerol-3-phosphate binding protein [Levilactobacillus acidifarinae DSM 19394]GEO68402.1 ABC transporter substrate-binding protein [Levilactobacillus acidifarinae]
MKRIRKLWGWLALLVVGVTLIGTGWATHQAAVARAVPHRTKILFWHEMTGPAQQELLRLVQGFNRSQTTYQVVPEFEGNYNEAVQKVIDTHGTTASPAVFQSMDISTSQLAHTGNITPVQKYIDEDHYDLKQIAPGARAFYANRGVQLSMPFNTSQPVLYYNATLLKKYHITPPPVAPTYQDITRVATQLTDRSHHKVQGMTVEIYGWLFEQFLANSGEELANQHDGHTGTPTEVNFTSPGALTAMHWIQTNLQRGIFVNYGAGANAQSNETASFLSGRLGMFLQSSALIGQLTTGNPDRLGISDYPHPVGKRANGVAIGGASLWLSNDKSAHVQRGAWDFIKYLMTAKSQAAWQVATGYLALNQRSAQTPALRALFRKLPATRVPGNQLRATAPNQTNSGIFLQGLIQERNLTQTAMEQIYQGADPRRALSTAQRAMTSYVQNNNRANGYQK